MNSWSLATKRRYVRPSPLSFSPTDSLPGGFGGAGGWLHILAHIAQVRDQPQLLELATEIALRAERGFDESETVDVIGGAAGAIRPLLNLFRLTENRLYLKVAVAAGEHIVDSAEPQEHGHAWCSPAGSRPLTGFAHGAAGIAWALLTLCRETGDSRFREAAVGGIEYERGMFVAPEVGWQDLRWTGGRCAPYWCHGSVGIGLARLDTLDVLNDEDTRRDIDFALRATANHGFKSDHSLCHGQTSACELFAVAAAAGVVDFATARNFRRRMLDEMAEVGYTTGFPLGLQGSELRTLPLR